MTERRFRAAGPFVEGARITLPAGASHHVKVLRLAEGEAVVLFDGDGNEADAVLCRVGDAPEVELGAVRRAREPWHVVLVLGMPKSSVIDQVLRGATEAGASEIRLFPADRSVSQADGERAARKLERFQRVVDEAARQSERARIPTVFVHRSLDEALEALEPGTPTCALDARVGDELTAALTAEGSARGLVIGPEGGLTERELARTRARGGRVARARLPVLRVETAAAVLTALAVLAAQGPAIAPEMPQMR